MSVILLQHIILPTTLSLYMIWNVAVLGIIVFGIYMFIAIIAIEIIKKDNETILMSDIVEDDE